MAQEANQIAIDLIDELTSKTGRPKVEVAGSSEEAQQLEDRHQVAQSEAREKMDAAFREQEEAWSSVFDQQIRPLEEEIYKLEDELGELYREERSLVRELQAVETRVEPMEVSIEDSLMDLLRAAINSIDNNSQSESGQ